jgi:hypothetical protein
MFSLDYSLVGILDTAPGESQLSCLGRGDERAGKPSAHYQLSDVCAVQWMRWAASTSGGCIYGLAHLPGS